MLSEATGCSLGKLLLSSWLLTSSITLWGTVRGVCIRLIQYSGNHPPHTFASKYYAKRGLIFRSLLDYNILFQITEVLPKTFSGKKVREPLKGLAQNLSMHGKLWQEICTTDIKKYCCPDLLRVRLVWCSLMHEFIFLWICNWTEGCWLFSFISSYSCTAYTLSSTCKPPKATNLNQTQGILNWLQWLPLCIRCCIPGTIVIVQFWELSCCKLVWVWDVHTFGLKYLKECPPPSLADL